MNKSNVIFIMGPTASGKTELAMQLYDQMDCDLISVDSALVYRGMDIGTAKPSPAELQRYPHHLINVCEPDEPYSVSRFRDDCLTLIERAFEHNKQPVLVGGTMLYFKTLMQGIADLPMADEAVRKAINEEAQQSGWQALHQQLAEYDPTSAERIKPADSQRIQRAVEVYRITGKTLTEYFAEQENTALKYPIKSFALAPLERAVLRQRIRVRFESMLEAGLVEEVKNLIETKGFDTDLPALRSVGYRQVVMYLSGEYDYDLMIEKAVTATSRLAKRQMTWLRSWPEVTWLETGSKSNTNKLISNL